VFRGQGQLQEGLRKVTRAASKKSSTKEVQWDMSVDTSQGKE